MTDQREPKSKSFLERLADFARLIFRARGTELGMSSEAAIKERLEEDRERRNHEAAEEPAEHAGKADPDQ